MCDLRQSKVERWFYRRSVYLSVKIDLLFANNTCSSEMNDWIPQPLHLTLNFEVLSWSKLAVYRRAWSVLLSPGVDNRSDSMRCGPDNQALLLLCAVYSPLEDWVGHLTEVSWRFINMIVGTPVLLWWGDLVLRIGSNSPRSRTNNWYTP